LQRAKKAESLGKRMILRLVLLLSLISLSAYAETLSSEDFHFRVSFPDRPDWSKAVRKASEDGTGYWIAEKSDGTMAFNISAMSGAASEGSFEDSARAWEKGLDAHITKKISSRDLKISGRDTREVVGSFRKDGKEIFIANYLVRDGDFAYSLAVVANDKNALKGGIAKEFLDSFEILPEKSEN
jgi:hypothetical protein